MSPEKSDRVAVLVAVRMKSTRLPGKSLLPLEGKPVLWHVMDRVKRASIPCKAVLCTSTVPEDDPIEVFARKNNFDFYRGHPENVLERFIGAAMEFGIDHLVRVTGDNPLTDPWFIDEMSRVHIKEEADYTYTGDPPRGTRPEIISLSAMKKCLQLAEDPNYSEYMTLYFRDYPQIFKNVLFSSPIKEHHRPHYLVTVDTPADFKVVERIYAHCYKKNSRFSIEEVIAFLDAHPEINHESREKNPINLSKINTRLKI